MINANTLNRDGISACEMITLDTISKVVEFPFVEACRYLYNLNIQTTSCGSGDGNSPNNTAGIAINFDSLSEENKVLCLAFMRKKGKAVMYDMFGQKWFRINVAFDENTTEQQLSDSLLKMFKAVGFKLQDCLWASYNYDEMAKEYAAVYEPKTKITKRQIERYIEDCYFLDRENQCAWKDKEHLDKHLSFLAKQTTSGVG